MGVRIRERARGNDECTARVVVRCDSDDVTASRAARARGTVTWTRDGLVFHIFHIVRLRALDETSPRPETPLSRRER